MEILLGPTSYILWWLRYMIISIMMMIIFRTWWWLYNIYMIMGTVDCSQGPHNRSKCPIDCWRSSWCCNNWCFQLGLRYIPLSWDYYQHQRSLGSESSLLFRTHHWQSDLSPFGLRCALHWPVYSPPHRPIPPWWHGQLSV